ncbi:MAG: UDP-diphospho-muramoylpentapeptide beta-N- acetylglucosaminyltransferase [Candidatus Magasanikbacteria bacterium GW2011_GWA2_37_8]|uniref:UDP-N-acetylglucosamine--N-acetylmuramyl-(pentapeptide) pyrophosphoryl-undecaprenol N-acetylglucosamine transferase n=1 Tax=Candidatus Magasanikbacteria bacterium GW2011_GWA2_37_8 TaxID=1619036 RepID=A0A0G0HPL7_9BACT|nr:MAG: UDP-diphospho-muramoylpentapeptide beta-N- acetylglucosaminyltransferase [Candidatus Magasanikbacteria bacterium GW2011_GWA2_37_8]
MKIVLSGGGTLGPVVPLLAITESYRAVYPKTEFIWVGTHRGPEKELIIKYNIPFFTLIAGKWRRYFSFWNLIDLFKIFIAFIKSLVFLWEEKPDLLISGGGFVSVPLHFAAALFGIPTWIHQQDVEPGLANKIMAKFATKITTALETGVNQFGYKSAEWIGNPSRDLTVEDKSISYEKFNLPEDKPVIFALGGGTGSARINQMVLEALPAWPRDWQVIHLVGRERPSELQERAMEVFKNYHVYKFFTDEMKDAYAIADVVIARAGFATLTELAALGKAAIILPMAGTHQEANIKIFSKEQAVVAFNERTDTGLKLAQEIKELILHPEQRELLGKKLQEILPRAKPDRIVEIIDELKNRD